MKRIACLLVCVAGAAGCSSKGQAVTDTPEQLSDPGGVIYSADGRFGVRFATRHAAQTASITIREGLQVNGLVSAVYEVSVLEPRLVADEVFYDLTGVESPATKAMIGIHEGSAATIGARLHYSLLRLVATKVDTSRKRFAVVELGFRNRNCDFRACERSCTHCDLLAGTCEPGRGRCDSHGACIADTEPLTCPEVPSWTATPGGGTTFVVSSVAIVSGNGGFNLNGECSQASGCINNALAPLAGQMNTPLRQGMLGGEALVLIELAGSSESASGDLSGATLKIYAGRDADIPFFPANNFTVPPRHTTCCEFTIAPRSLAGVPAQAIFRSPVSIEDGYLRTLAPSSMNLETSEGVTLRLQRVFVNARLAPDGKKITEGLCGAVVRAAELARYREPPRSPYSPPSMTATSTKRTFLDFARKFAPAQPDVDLDNDGLECLLDINGDGYIDRCCDGEVDACGSCSRVVAPVDPSKPESCVFAAEMADGYSVNFTFEAVAANVVGVR